MRSGKNSGKIYISASRSNIFVTVVSILKSKYKKEKQLKVLGCFSGGLKHEGLTKNRRTQKTSQSLFNIAKKVKVVVVKNWLKELILVCKMMRSNFYIRMFMSHLEHLNIRINYVKYIMSVAHNGVRKQKLPRK